MNTLTSDRRIGAIVAMRTPRELASELPLLEAHAQRIQQTRQRIADIIHGSDSRQMIIVGPCSIHDPQAAMAYAEKLLVVRQSLLEHVEIIMRVYFEKPRTIVGWKGLINDPERDGSFQIDKGLVLARKLLVELAAMGMPAACEFLDAASGQYYADTVSWGAIGARTTESQVHREIASGLSCPVGFKNATSGDVDIALDAMQAAAHAHAFLSPTEQGQIALFKTSGNPDTHLILRGGTQPNYDCNSVKEAVNSQSTRGIHQRILIDCNHANSAKDFTRQPIIALEIAQRLASESSVIAGLMIESHLVEGKQSIDNYPLTYGQSITDACLGWDDTKALLEGYANAVARIQ